MENLPYNSDQPYYYEVTADREDVWQPAEGDIMLSEGEYQAKRTELFDNIVHFDLKPLPSLPAANQQGETHAGEIPADLTEEQLSLYRQFLLRGDLAKGYLNLDASQLRYRFYDIDEDGIFELYFVTPKEADVEEMVRGRLQLDKDNRIKQSLVENPKESITADDFSEMMIGTEKFDTNDETLSYEKLIGNEKLDPEFTERKVGVDYEQNRQFTSERVLYAFYDDTLHTLPLSDDVVIYSLGTGRDVDGCHYSTNAYGIDDFSDTFRGFPRHVIIQTKGEEITAIWFNHLWA